MKEIEPTAEEIYEKKIRDEYERLKNLPQEEPILLEELLHQEAEMMKQNEYENRIVSKIRQRYSINQELAILRQRDSKPIEYQEYYDYVEQCKQETRNAVNQE